MEQSKRIKPEQVLAAFEKTGLKPVQGQYFNGHIGDACACGLGAIYAADLMNKGKSVETLFDEITSDNGGDDINELVWDFFESSHSFKYQNGFVNGFDEEDPTVMPNERRYEDYKNGFEDGKAAYQAVKHLIG